MCEKTEDGECPGGSDGSAVPERPEINTSQESATEEDCQPNHHTNASYVVEDEENPKSKNQVLSEADCDTDFTVLHNDVTTSNNNTSLSDRDTEKSKSHDKSLGQDKEREAGTIVVPAPSTPSDPLHPRSPDPRSPAPFGQQHVRTQVSLEVVQCRSAATSPMTPPEGGNSFFFPSSFGRSGEVDTDTKGAELQVGQKEFCSVATSPMTPKMPSVTAFPELTGRESVQKVKKCEEPKEQKSFPAAKSLTEAESEKTSCPSASLMNSQVTVKDNEQCKQQRMGSMEQDITILVTHYGNKEEEEEEKPESSFYSIEPEMVKIDEYEELGKSKGDAKMEDVKEEISAATAHTRNNANTSEQSMTRIKSDNSGVKENTAVCEEFSNVTKPPVPESPAPFGCQNIRTQVSLEVVQCHSVATSPMTPPEGDQAFYFPSNFGRGETVSAESKDAEPQVRQQVEFRSVATAPMTPRTPITTTFPEIRKQVSTEEKIVEEDKKQHAEMDEGGILQEEEKLPDENEKEAAEDDKKELVVTSKEKGEDKCEEPVQEVSWDEKGMTWEVYGAVVEVSVLGSAIQKHLEKQVKKQKKPSMPPPPPLTPSATPLTSESTQGGSGSGKGPAGKRGERDGKVRRRRRNPFRLLMENMQQPHCCSRAHTTE